MVATRGLRSPQARSSYRPASAPMLRDNRMNSGEPMRAIIVTALLCACMGCGAVKDFLHEPQSYYECIEIDTTTKSYTFRQVNEPAGFTTIIKAQAQWVIVGESQRPDFSAPTLCRPGLRWPLREIYRPNEAAFT